MDGSGGSDPDGGTLTYLCETSTPATSITYHTYAADGTYSVTLRVRDDHDQPATSKPGAGAGKGGQQGDHAEDNRALHELALPGGAGAHSHRQRHQPRGRGVGERPAELGGDLSHNNSHTHPSLKPTTGNIIKITAPLPKDLSATDNGNYLEIRLTDTDSNGTSPWFRRGSNSAR